MVKLKGPALSTAATGRLADVLIFCKNQNTPYAKKHSAPANPRSPTQVSARAMVSFLAQQWKNQTAAQMATWFDRATKTHIANYHAYVAANSVRWNSTLWPSKEDPATETAPAPNFANMVVVARHKHADMRIIAPTGPIPWAVTVHRSTSAGFSWQRSNMVAVVLIDVAADVWWTDTPLATGTYYYRLIAFNDTGKRAGPSTQRSVTIA